MMLSSRTINILALASVLTVFSFPSYAADVRGRKHRGPIEVIPIGEYALFPAYMIGNPHCYLRHVEVNDHGVLRIITEPVCN